MQSFLISSHVVSRSSHWLKIGEGREWKKTRVFPMHFGNHIYLCILGWGYVCRSEDNLQLSILSDCTTPGRELRSAGLEAILPPPEPPLRPTAQILKPFSREAPVLNDTLILKRIDNMDQKYYISSHATSIINWKKRTYSYHVNRAFSA